jgi:hypothetical protein
MAEIVRVVAAEESYCWPLGKKVKAELGRNGVPGNVTNDSVFT